MEEPGDESDSSKLITVEVPADAKNTGLLLMVLNNRENTIFSLLYWGVVVKRLLT